MKPPKKSTKTVYLDYAATTPVDPRVVKAMQPYWTDLFGNPSSLYRLGVESHMAVEKARQFVAGVFSCSPAEIVFTAGGTESINLALFGVARAHKNIHGKKPHIITTQIEHHAVLESVRALALEGYAVTYLRPDSEGFITPEQVASSLRPETILVSVMYANNEIGTIEPITQIGKVIEEANRKRITKGLPVITFHSDACQATGFLDIRPNQLNVDLLSINGSKIYGPKQVGCLYVRKGTKLAPLIYGGGQEKELRSGTENVPGVIGFAKALELQLAIKEKELVRLGILRDYFIDRLLKKVSNIEINGPEIVKNNKVKYLRRLPNNLNIIIDGVEGEALILYLDSYNIAASTGSACSSTNNDPSHVLLAIGRTEEQAKSSVRFSLGKDTDKKKIDYTVNVLHFLTELLRVK